MALARRQSSLFFTPGIGLQVQFFLSKPSTGKLFFHAHFAFASVVRENVRHKIAVPPETVQRLAPEVMVAIEFGRLAPRRHHTFPDVVLLYFICVAYGLARSLAVLLRFLLHLFVLIHIEFQHLNVAFDVVFALVRFGVKQILVLCRRCKRSRHQQ